MSNEQASSRGWWWARQLSLWFWAVVFVGSGVVHLVRPGVYAGVVPDALPVPMFWILLTGVAEIAGGVGLLVPRLRRWAAAGLVLMLVAFLWVHVAHLFAPPVIEGEVLPRWLLSVRLLLQFVFIAWVGWVGGAGRWHRAAGESKFRR